MEKFIRKFLLILIFSFQFYAFSIPAEDSSKGSQFVLPKNVYVGDTAEIRYLFRSDVNLLSDDLNSPSSYLELVTDFRIFNKMSEKCLVKKASVSRVGTEYTLVLEIVVWKAEQIDFPPFDLGTLIHFSKENTSTPVFWIDLEPIEVNSIAKKNGVTSFLPSQPPVLLPGTVTIVVIISLLCLILLFVLIFSLVHIPVISDFFERILVSFFMKKNSRVAVRKFRKLLKNESKFDDADFAFQFQSILREFLSSHFNEDFSSCTTADFLRSFNEIFLGEVPIEFERFVDIFSRIDYIRFAKGQVDSEFQHNQEVDERKNLIEEVIFTISVLGCEFSTSESASFDVNGEKI